MNRHYQGLTLAILLGTALRFWHLDFKPLWLDEVITALFSLGRSYNDVPLEVVFSFDALQQIFTFNPTATCPQIAHTLATQSTHPPLFFCLMYRWLKTIGTHYSSLSTALRSLPALFGVGAIAAIYALNRIAFSKAAGLMAAFVMAVSPFGVYLSQEARHYTLPILLITLALIGLIIIQKDLEKNRLQPFVLLSWASVNSIGFYVHYFFILAYIAQLLTLFFPCKDLIINILKTRKILPYQLLYITFCLLPLASFIPWLPVLLNDTGSSDSSWLPHPHNIAPLYQIIAAWLTMVIALPIESQPLWIAIPSGFLMVLFGWWLVRHIFKGIKQLWQTSLAKPATLILAIFTLCLLLEMLAIVYLLGKDITVAFRYHFVYYPAICALIGAAITSREIKYKTITHPLHPLQNQPVASLLTVGIISCIFVVYGLAFQKSYPPERFAKNMNLEPSVPLMVVVGYNDYQDVAMGLSFALALEKVRTEKPETYFAFYKRSPGYDSVWQNLSQIPPIAASYLNLWVVAPGLKQQNYPPQLALSSQKTCAIDPAQYHRIGVPYQLYRCR